MTVFIDAGGWLSVVIQSDQHHAAGRAYFEGLIAATARIITTDFVLDETITRLRYDVGHQASAGFLRLVRQAEGSGTLTIHRIGFDLWREAESLFLQYADVRLSFTDCTSFALLRVHPVEEVFGFDRHFTILGHTLRPGE